MYWSQIAEIKLEDGRRVISNKKDFKIFEENNIGKYCVLLKYDNKLKY